MRHQLCGTILVSSIAFAGSALGADIPGDATTQAKLKLGTKYQTSVLDRDNDADWYQVRLNKGKHFAFQLDFAPPYFNAYCGTGHSLDLALADAGGRVLKRDSADLCYDDGGFELTITRTGIYFVRVSGPKRVGYKVRAAVDAVNGTNTKAILQVNKLSNATLLFGYDIDYYKVGLQGRKT